MDPFLAAYRANLPILNDARTQQLGLGHALLMARSSVDAPEVKYLLDSVDGFRLSQGWDGFHYSFQPISHIYEALPSESYAEPFNQYWRFDGISDTERQRGLIFAQRQEPCIMDSGEGFAAIRSFVAVDYLIGILEVTSTARHPCGDGTRVRVLLQHAEGEQVELFSIATLEHPSEFFSTRISLSPGSAILAVVEPLGTDECDAVDVEFKVKRAGIETPWIAPKASLVARAARGGSLEDEAPTEEASTIEEGSFDKAFSNSTASSDFEPVDVIVPHPVMDVALIFDENRLKHVQAVLRSAAAVHSPGQVIFHLVCPISLHVLSLFAAKEDEEAFDFQFYDLERCSRHVAWVQAFSDPRIHLSALCKFFLPQILPTELSTVLYLDNDVSITSKLDGCFENEGDKSINMVVDMGDICALDPDACWPLPMSSETGPMLVNGGVALLQLDRLRSTNFLQHFIHAVASSFAATNRVARFGDQDFINAFFRLYPDEIGLLPCGCNYQVRGSARNEVCGGQEVSILHAW
jgi:lipopolysaccharide biosynthesis glycosyltransferase